MSCPVLSFRGIIGGLGQDFSFYNFLFGSFSFITFSFLMLCIRTICFAVCFSFYLPYRSLRSFRFLRLPSVGLQTPETGLPPGPFVCLLCRILSGLQSLKSLWTLKTLETLETLSLSGGLLVFQIRRKDNIKVTLVFL